MLLLCCAQESVRERWSQGIADASNTHPIHSYDELKQTLTETTTDLILLHLKLPGLDPLRGVAELRMNYPDSQIFVLSNTPNDEEGLALLRFGIRGYANTHIDPGLLSRAIAVVRAGEVWVGRKLMTRLIEGSASRGRRRGDLESKRVLNLLTDREREIALLVSRGTSNKQIARELDITERTVKAHISSIFDKVGAQDRLQLALLVNGHCGSLSDIEQTDVAKIA